MSRGCSVWCLPGACSRTQGALANTWGGPFAVLNGSMAQDALCVVVPKGKEVAAPIYVLYMASGAVRRVRGLPARCWRGRQTRHGYLPTYLRAAV